jgi:uncharacterized membrane protein YhaH (DUF805 family)
MNVLNQVLSKDGRFSRKAYVLGFVLPGAVLLAGTYASFTFAPQLLSGPVSPAISLGWFAYLTTMDAQNIRRYHDLGNSGVLYRMLRPLLVILPLLAFALQFLIPAQLASMGDMAALAFLIQQEVAFHMSPIPLAILALWFVGLVTNIAYLAIMPGNTGPNTFGPDPRGGGGSFLGGSGGGAPSPANGGDPVERTLAEYRISLAQKAQQVQSTRAQSASTGAAPRPAATFGKKR